MNSLSWLLYAADVLGNLRPLLGFLATLMGAGAVISYIVRCASADWENTVGRSKVGMPAFPVLGVAAAVALGLSAAAIPSSNTLYMIAASETGQRLVETPEAKEMLDLVRRRVKAALEDSAAK